ncbi:MAG: outer membrane lipoprotein carrier protein LolA [Burkholderiales bacterium]|nr:outer membrane lipoprotein carrier protein LolA [Burkholderiales bacterium]
MGGARGRRAPLSGGAAAALCLALLAAPGAPRAAAAFDLERLMRELAAREAATVRFEETRHSDALREPLVATGELRYRRPARLERRMLTPRAERYTIDGGAVTIERDGNERTFALDGLPVLRVFVESIRATLAGDLAALRRHYQVLFAGQREAWTIALLPADAALAEYVTSVRISGSGDRIERMETLETSGDRVVTRFVPVSPPAPGPAPASATGRSG